MTRHIAVPGVELREGAVNAVYVDYLREWREEAIRFADDGDVAASTCHQACLIDLALHGAVRHDWLAIMREFLTSDGAPLAYSEAFGRRLYKFGGQYRQSTIHAIHTRWWLESLNDAAAVDHRRFAALVLAKRQPDGLIYDRDVSETTLRHRMKVELTLSMAMAAEILGAAELLTAELRVALATEITAPAKCPALGYMSMEYFRLQALRILGHEDLFPVGVDTHIEGCTTDLLVGWCDFAMSSKVDAYMGTAKRTSRDKPVHTPLIAACVASLLEKVQDAANRNLYRDRLIAYACHLKKNPLDIPAFRMRDLPMNFGAEKTPIEVLCASSLISKCPSA